MGSPEGEGYDDERPQHLVKVPSFMMGKYPITQAQWREVASLPKIARDLPLTPSHDLPVENISWYEVREFCLRLLWQTGQNYRLPTEAEWEFACRAYTNTPFHFGNKLTHEQANFESRLGDTSPVGKYPGNALGLHDMHGNVWEWCLDHWHEDYEGAPSDGSAWVTGGNERYRMLRGGSWYADSDCCRSAFRNRNDPVNRGSNIGFRVVRDIRDASTW